MTRRILSFSFRDMSVRSLRRGFSMVEAAIVFGIMGLVISGVWIAYATVREKQFTDLAVGETFDMINNARSLYTGRYTHALPATQALQCAEGVIRRGLCDDGVVNPWGGAYSIIFRNAPRSITVQLLARDDATPLPTRGCTDMLMILSGSLRLQQRRLRSGGNWIVVPADPAQIGAQMDASGCQGIEITTNL